MVGHRATDVVAGCVGPVEVQSDQKKRKFETKSIAIEKRSQQMGRKSFLRVQLSGAGYA
jgi:hypothetical protein